MGVFKASDTDIDLGKEVASKDVGNSEKRTIQR